jgi:hypothetical protein
MHWPGDTHSSLGITQRVGSHPEDVITRQDGDNKTWAYTYGAPTGYVLTESDPMSPADATHYAYDSAGSKICSVAPKGNTTCPNSPLGTYETKFTYGGGTWGSEGSWRGLITQIILA